MVNVEGESSHDLPIIMGGQQGCSLQQFRRNFRQYVVNQVVTGEAQL